MRIALLTLAASAAAGMAFVGTGGGAVTRAPGLWTLDTKVEKLEATGVPGATSAELEAALFGKLLGAPRETCVSAEDAAKPVSAQDMRMETFGGEACTYTRSDLSGGKVDFAGTCRSPAAGAERDFTLTGTVAPDTMDLLVTFDDRNPSQGASIQSALRITLRRTGECNPAESRWNGGVTAASASEAAADVTAAGEEARNALAVGY